MRSPFWEGRKRAQKLTAREARQNYRSRCSAETSGPELFDATAMHGIEDIGTQQVSYLSIVFTLRH